MASSSDQDLASTGTLSETVAFEVVYFTLCVDTVKGGWYQYQHAISAGFKQNFNLCARARSSFDHHFEITNEDSRVWFWTVGVFLSYFARVYRVEYLAFLGILSF